MRSPAERLRDALETFRYDAAWRQVCRWRRAEDASSAAELAREHAWLASGEAQEALEEASRGGLVTASEHAALAAHLAAARREAAVAEARDRIEAIGSDLWARSEEALGPCAEAWGRAAEVGGAATHADAGPPLRELADHAASLLERTDEGLQETVRRLVPELSGGRPPALEDLAQALRAPELDGLFPVRGRWRRVAGDVRALGFERELSARVRVEREHGDARPHVSVAVVRAPTDVRIAPAPRERGLASDLAAAEGVGRALAHGLVSPGLPVELRRPVVGSVARAVGVLFAQVPVEHAALRRLREMGREETDRVSRLAGATLLLETRLSAASVQLVAQAGPSLTARRAHAPDWVRRALGVEVDTPQAALAAGLPEAVAARYRGRVAGLAAWHGLRERFDEDWYRNPRAQEPLRAAAHRGGWLSAERWVRDELGAEPGSEIRRLQELTAG